MLASQRVVSAIQCSGRYIAIDQRHPLSYHSGEKPDLAVIRLTQPPVPLPGDAGRHVAFLGEAALVENRELGAGKVQGEMEIEALKRQCDQSRNATRVF